MDYHEFLLAKQQLRRTDGIAVDDLPDYLFGFQRVLVEWALQQSRCAIFADCGLGKTPMQLVWADIVAKHTGKPTLILTPLAVSGQTLREANKFGVDAMGSRDGTHSGCGVVVTNYERLHYFEPDQFGGVVCDESSAIKAFEGKRRKQVTRFLAKKKFRLMCTATAAPNDFIELGTHSEALGELTQSDMLQTFFKSSDNARHSLFKEGDFWNRAKYFFRAHAEQPFWRWVCSWARAVRTPSDLGFDDDGFILPPLNVQQYTLPSTFCWPGELFPRIAGTLREQRVERRMTMQERCDKVGELVDHDEPAVVWCQYNDEGDILEKMIPGSVQVAGRHSDDEKEDKLKAFTFGEVRVLITKPKIGAWGLNWQHCGHHTFFPSHSFEQYYQAVRRSLRFGRVGPVRVDIVTTEGEEGVTENLTAKQLKADEMFRRLVEEMNRGKSITIEDLHTKPSGVPDWLQPKELTECR